MVKILKSDNPKESDAYLTIGVLKSLKWRNQLSKFAIYHWVNGQLGQKSSKLHHLGFKCQSKTFTVYLKDVKNYDFAEISKSNKMTPTGIFSHISISGLAQKRLISTEWITFCNISSGRYLLQISSRSSHIIFPNPLFSYRVIIRCLVLYF